MFKRKSSDNPLVSSLFFAGLVLLFHVGLLAAIGLVVLVFRGIVNYFFWILLGGGLLAAGALYLLYRYMKKEKSVLADILQSPEYKDRRVEVNFLGGLASFKIGSEESSRPAIEDRSAEAAPMLEDSERMQVRELSELARLFEKDLITLEEYEKAKKKLLDSENG
ncbi:MAG: SHOCT domain-containing protein [Desulfosalsimonadaceae bacterium]